MNAGGGSIWFSMPARPDAMTCRIGEVWVHVGPRNPALDAQTWPRPDNTKACRAVVRRPSQRRWGPAPCLEPLVRVHRRRVAHHHLGHVPHPTAEEPAKLVRARDARKVTISWEHIGQLSVRVRPQAHVEMRARPGLRRIRFCHERDTRAELLRNLFGRLLQHNMAVRHLQNRCIANVQLVLSSSELSLS